MFKINKFVKGPLYGNNGLTLRFFCEERSNQDENIALAHSIFDQKIRSWGSQDKLFRDMSIFSQNLKSSSEIW